MPIRRFFLNVRADGKLFVQLAVEVDIKKNAFITITKGDEEGRIFKITANEASFCKMLYLIGGPGYYSLIINRSILKRRKRGEKKDKGFNRFGTWILDNNSYKRVLESEKNFDYIYTEDELIELRESSGLFSKYFKSTRVVGEVHGF